MEILNTIQNTAQAVYNLIGANGIRAISSAVKVGVNYLMQKDIQASVASSALQLGLAYTTSVVSNSSVVTAGAIVAESALINGAFYGCQKTIALIGQIKYDSMKIHVAPQHNLATVGVNVAIDAIAEGIIYGMEEGYDINSISDTDFSTEF